MEVELKNYTRVDDDIVIESPQVTNVEDVINEMPKSAKEVYTLLKEQGDLSPKEIIEITDKPPRTIRYALNKLLKVGLIKKYPSFSDMRRRVYTLAGN